ncbi:hypothetical protein Tco_0937239 [Tanacetum coccineum]|uniref:Uncharacterized protein n=1 Tax=Tanacetum coccineum TaxID=301880 RepID=A0ABQ5DKQ4_9ASTR
MICGEMMAHRLIVCWIVIFFQVEDWREFLTLDVTIGLLAVGNKHYVLGYGVRVESCLSPLLSSEERGLKRHFNRLLLSLWCEHTVATASAQNDNGSLEAESIMKRSFDAITMLGCEALAMKQIGVDEVVSEEILCRGSGSLALPVSKSFP